MVEDVVVLDEVGVVLPDPSLQFLGEIEGSLFWRRRCCRVFLFPANNAAETGSGSRLKLGALGKPLVKKHVGAVGLLDAQVEELVRHLVVRPRVDLASEALAGNLVWIKTLHFGVVERVPLVFWTATVPENGKFEIMKSVCGRCSMTPQMICQFWFCTNRLKI